MDQKTLNTLGRFNKVKKFFDDHATVVASVGALAAAVGTFAGLMALLPKTAAAAPTEGATKDKGKAREKTIARFVPLASALRVYFQQAGDLERAAAMTIRQPSKLDTMAALRFEALVAKALEFVDELPAGALDAYNHKAEDIELFRAAAAEFGIKSGRPKAVINANKTAGEQLDEQVDATADYIDETLKPAVDMLGHNHPEFVRGFKQANKTDDTPGKQNKALRQRNQQKRDEAAAKGADPNTPPIPPNGTGVGS